MNTYIVESKKLVKNYESGEVVTKVLHGVDFKVKEGEFVAVMGPSGSGKSTLMYQLGLIDNPTDGEIFIEGRDMVNIPQYERDDIRLNELGFVFQDYALVPELTAAENVMVPLLMAGYTSRKAYERAVDYLGRVGLGERVNNLPSQLSGGEQQRVSVVRAVSNDPKILFADEPTASLDSEMSKGVLSLLHDLNKKGQTIIMVTHEEEYGNLAERIVFLRDGVIESDRKTKKRPTK